MLRCALAPYPWTAGFAEELERRDITDVEFVTVDPIIKAFRQMTRDNAFDVCEFALSTYFVAKAFDLPFSAIPVFPLRFVHPRILCSSKAGVTSVKDLEGKRVGIRAYTVTAGVWARAFLAAEFGLDLDEVTWVLGDDEHVQRFHEDVPPNLEYRMGEDLDALLADGELAAVIASKAAVSDTIVPLIADQIPRAEAWARTRGIFPINHTIVIGDEARRAAPDVARSVYEAFVAAKADWLRTVDSGGPLSPAEEAVLERREWLGSDPLPYGVQPNQPTLESLADTLDAQHIPVRRPIDELFLPVDEG
jgi:4,5-dihydroxyphthalate decarboxylase